MISGIFHGSFGGAWRGRLIGRNLDVRGFERPFRLGIRASIFSGLHIVGHAASLRRKLALQSLKVGTPRRLASAQ